jgi:hypothetical protein
MKAFIKTLLAFDPEQEDGEGGILGVVKAYYGTVEAQGRRSLHCHMMVWVSGSLNPNEINAKALQNGGNLEFQKRLISLSNFHPCATRGLGPSLSPDDAADALGKDIHNLAERCQRHRSTHTCYKYWKGLLLEYRPFAVTWTSSSSDPVQPPRQSYITSWIIFPSHNCSLTLRMLL